MPIPSPILQAISLELRELEAVAARLRDLSEEEQLELDPRIAAVREALRALTAELERRALIVRALGRRWRDPAIPRSLRDALRVRAVCRRRARPGRVLGDIGSPRAARARGANKTPATPGSRARRRARNAFALRQCARR